MSSIVAVAGLALLLAPYSASSAPQGHASPCPLPGEGPGSYIDEHLIYFALGSAAPPKSERTQVVLRSALCWIARQASKVKVVGHADSAGEAEANMALSIRRARAVAEALIDLGVPRDSITVEGRGEQAPAVATGDGVAEPLNRWVLIGILPR